MQLQVIVDNMSGATSLLGEHGLAMFLESEEARILIDGGQGKALLPNATALGIDLSRLDHIVLSHGHYDHTWGVAQVLLKKADTLVWAHPAFMGAHYAIRKGQPCFIGCNLRGDLINHKPILGCVEITKDVFAFDVPVESRNEEFVPSVAHLVISKDGGFIQDDFLDDISLVVRGRHGLSVILGCAHAGSVNVLERAASLFGTREFYAVIGGMHLGEQSTEMIDRITSILVEEFQISMFRPAHCTGFAAAAMLAAKAPDVKWAAAGTVIEL